ncbi:flagellar basal body L-ring protein FlgH [Marinobacteraceae bacterium S3BR75-40.1]
MRLTSVLLILGLAGCTAMTRPRATPDDPAYAPVPPRQMASPQPVSGSIFQSSRDYNPYGDRKAINVGDILTVQLQEQTASSKTAATSITKDQQLDLENPTFFGNNVTSGDLSLGASADMQRDFAGDAEADQSNSLQGNITVTVVDRLPNGILKIRGEKWLSLTNGDEYIRLTGLVRPEDISPNNEVVSTRIADARIGYGGTGDFDQANQMGWLARFFNSEWFPL